MEAIKNRLKDYKKKLTSEKLFISFIPILLGIDYENEKNCLISNYEEIKTILDLKEENIYKYLYFNKKKIHGINGILYEEEEVINVDFEIEKTMIFYFYLNLLINDNETIVNYLYSNKFINEITNLQKKIRDTIYKKIIISKIIIDLIYNYKQSDNYKEEEEEILNEIENENKAVMGDNFKPPKKIGLEEIYIEIIKSLIKSKKFDNYEETYQIISELELENIIITKTMFDNLNNILNSEECKYYIINNIEDLLNQKKTNFYYILLKYILKNTIYIYNIESLNKTRKIILELIKNKKDNIYNEIINSDFKDKIEYIIETFTDSKYYYEKYENSLNNIKDITNEKNTKTNTKDDSSEYFNNSSYMNNQNQINKSLGIPSFISQNSIEEKTNENNALKDKIYYQILTKSSFTFQINNKGEPYFIYNDKYKDKKIEFDELKTITINEEKEKKSFDKFLQFFEDFQNVYKKRITDKINDLKINLEFNQDIKSKEKNNLYYINLKYIIEEYEIEENEENILNINDLNMADGINNLINNLIEKIKDNEFYVKQKSKETSKTTKEKSNSSSIRSIPYIDRTIISKKETTSYDNSKLIEDLLKKDNKYKILKIKKIIGEHNKPAEIIIETKKGILISGSIDEILYLYNSNKEFKEKIDLNSQNQNAQNNNIDPENERYKIKWALNIYEKKTNNENSEELLICTKSGLLSLDINENRDQNNPYTIINNKTCSSYFELDNNNFLIGGEDGITLISNDGDAQKEKILYDKPIRGGIEIEGNIIAFTSNSTLPNGNDTLILYDKKNHKIIEEIKDDYSFTISTNSLSTMEAKDIFILLCGCKKYNKKNNYKNGILLIDLYKVNNDDKYFLETGDFEVYCFCPISYIINDNKDIYYTDYFLAGGFSNKKNEGMVKLYKLKKNEKNNIIIEFMQDIIFKEEELEFKNNIKENNLNSIRDKNKKYYFSGFERNVSCITQSKINGDLYITCWDGKVFLFEQPNIGYYLDWDKLEKEENQNKT